MMPSVLRNVEQLLDHERARRRELAVLLREREGEIKRLEARLALKEEPSSEQAAKDVLEINGALERRLKELEKEKSEETKKSWEKEYRTVACMLTVQEEIESTLIGEVNRLRSVVRTQRLAIKKLASEFSGPLDADYGVENLEDDGEEEVWDDRMKHKQQKRVFSAPVRGRTANAASRQRFAKPLRRPAIDVKREVEPTKQPAATAVAQAEQRSHSHSPSPQRQERADTSHTDPSLHPKPWTPTRAKEIVPDILDYGLTVIDKTITVDPNKEHRAHAEAEAQRVHQRGLSKSPRRSPIPSPRRPQHQQHQHHQHQQQQQQQQQHSPRPRLPNNDKVGSRTPPRRFTLRAPGLGAFRLSAVPGALGAQGSKGVRYAASARGGASSLREPSVVAQALHKEVDHILEEIALTINKDKDKQQEEPRGP